MTKVHGLLIIIWGAVHSTHHTLIITEEEDGKSGDTINGYEKTALLQLVNDIVLRNKVHGGEVDVFPDQRMVLLCKDD